MQKKSRELHNGPLSILAPLQKVTFLDVCANWGHNRRLYQEHISILFLPRITCEAPGLVLGVARIPAVVVSSD